MGNDWSIQITIQKLLIMIYSTSLGFKIAYKYEDYTKLKRSEEGIKLLFEVCKERYVSTWGYIIQLIHY